MTTLWVLEQDLHFLSMSWKASLCLEVRSEKEVCKLLRKKATMGTVSVSRKFKGREKKMFSANMRIFFSFKRHGQKLYCKKSHFGSIPKPRLSCAVLFIYQIVAQVKVIRLQKVRLKIITQDRCRSIIYPEGIVFILHDDF